MFEIPKITVRLVKEPKQCYSDTQIKGPEDVELYEVTTLAEEHFFCVFLSARRGRGLVLV